MKKIESLRLEALDACRFRGHYMARFKRNGNSAYSDCRVCGRSVVINTRPMPNQIDIGGAAVAIPCEVRNI